MLTIGQNLSKYLILLFILGGCTTLQSDATIVEEQDFILEKSQELITVKYNGPDNKTRRVKLDRKVLCEDEDEELAGTFFKLLSGAFFYGVIK